MDGRGGGQDWLIWWYKKHTLCWVCGRRDVSNMRYNIHMGQATGGGYCHMVYCVSSYINKCVICGQVTIDKDVGNVMHGLVIFRDTKTMYAFICAFE